MRKSAIGILLLAVLAGCEAGPTGALDARYACTSSSDCGEGFSCISGECLPGTGAGGGGAGGGGGAATGGGGGAGGGTADSGNPDSGQRDAGNGTPCSGGSEC